MLKKKKLSAKETLIIWNPYVNSRVFVYHTRYTVKQRNLVNQLKCEKTQLVDELDSIKFYLHISFASNYEHCLSLHKVEKNIKLELGNIFKRNISYQFWMIKITYRNFHTWNDIENINLALLNSILYGSITFIILICI